MIRNSRWLMVTLAFLGIIICYMDRSALSYAIHPLEIEFHLNNSQFGLLLSAFGIGYLVMVFVGGVLVDNFGAHKVWGAAAFIWSIATMLIGFCSSFGILLFLRFMVGVSEGPSFPALTRVATDWLPLKERNRALAFGLAAVPFASVIGAPLSTHLIYYYSWQVMFIFLGIIGILWSFIWLIFFRNTPNESRLTSHQELNYIRKEKAKEPSNLQISKNPTKWQFILFNKTFLINNYAFFAFGYLLFFGVTWLPGYLEQSFHLALRSVGIFLILPWLLAALAIMTNGCLSDWLWHKTQSLRISRSLLIGGGMLLSALCFIPAIITHNMYIAIIFISLAIAIGLAPNSCFYALNADLAPDKAATSLGVMDVFLALAGIIAPTITGWLSSITGNFKIAIGIMFVLNISSAILVLFFQNPDEDLLRNNI